MASSDSHSIRRAELRHIPLSRIVVKEGLNPRGQVNDDEELEAMAETMRERGCLQSVRVRPLPDGDYLLIAGERRYRAAAKAGLTEIPASIRPDEMQADEQKQEIELATEALVENELRSDLNPLQRASAYQHMLGLGLSIRGLAERLGGKKKRAARERRIREHLPILTLPEDLRVKVADGEIPLLAVKALQGLGEIHEDLARNAVAAVLDAPEDEEPYTWVEVAREPLAVAIHCERKLPADVFLAYESYPLDSFTLGEKAAKNLAALQKLRNHPLSTITFTAPLVDAVRPLNVVHAVDQYSQLIVGQDVGDRIAEDYIAAALKTVRANARRERQHDQRSQPDTGSLAMLSSQSTDGQPQAPADQGTDLATSRQQEQEHREAAYRFNEQLGVLAWKAFARIKVDERVLRIFASVDLGGELREIIERGARLSFPGWVSQERRSVNARPKTVVLEAKELQERAERFLSAASSPGEIVGRSLLLIALACLVDQRAIAASYRSPYTLRFSGPWARQANLDLHAIVRERIKEGQLPALDELLDERARREEQVQQARERLQGVADRITELSHTELEQAISDAQVAHGPYSLDLMRLRNEHRHRENQQATTQTSQEPVAA